MGLALLGVCRISVLEGPQSSGRVLVVKERDGSCVERAVPAHPACSTLEVLVGLTASLATFFLLFTLRKEDRVIGIQDF